MTKLDLTGVEAWAPDTTPPPGSYPCTLDEAKVGQSRGGFPQIEMSWTVIGGNFAGAEIRDWLVISEHDIAKAKVVNLLQSCGKEITAEFDIEADAPSLTGSHSTVVLRQEPSYKNPEKMVTRVAGYKPLSEAAASQAAGSSNGAADPDLPF